MDKLFAWAMAEIIVGVVTFGVGLYGGMTSLLLVGGTMVGCGLIGTAISDF